MNKGEVLEVLQTFKNKEIDVVVVTLIEIVGSSPQDVGAKIIVSSNGLEWGTVGGGKVEAKTIQHAKEFLNSKRSFECCKWNLQSDVGMTCGGVVTFTFDQMKFGKSVHQSDWTVAIFGAGHVAQEVIRLLIKLDCKVKCIDPRLDWLFKLPDHPNLEKIHTESMKDYLNQLPANTYVASMTMGHSYDLPILFKAMKEHQFPYLGVIGSDSKAVVLKNDLVKLGADQKQIDQLICPIGLPIGNNSPIEIAISIVSQLIQKRDLK